MKDDIGPMNLIDAMRLGLFTPQQPEPNPETLDFRSVEILRLQPGDTLVYSTPNWLPKTEFERTVEQLKKFFPEDVKLAILHGGAYFNIVRKTEEENDNAVVDG